MRTKTDFTAGRRLAGIIMTGILATMVTTWLAAERLSIGQVNTERLLPAQQITLYLSFEAPGASDLAIGNLTIEESADGVSYVPVPRVIDVSPVRSLDAPLSFFILVDNSGSMYDERTEGGDGPPRIDAARQAIRDFVNSITNEQDQVGLAVFNTRYAALRAPSRDKAALGPILESISRPSREEGYTELYHALVQASADARAAGRQTVVVLSDGENYPYSVYEQRPHPEFQDRLFTYQDAIDAFQREGLSVFAIHYGDREDPNLDTIAAETGGAVYRASGAEELAAVYTDIRTRLLAEYRVTYRPTMLSADRRLVRVSYSDGNLRLRAVRPYFANTLFAGGARVDIPMLGIVFGLGVVGIAVLLILSVKAGGKDHSLVVLDPGGVKGLQKTI
ncbi:MAG: VWA domain-containing protein, partial [Spirochaetales bacterium]